MDYFRNNVLKISGGLEDMGSLDTGLVSCLVLTYVMIYFCISKGIKSSSKVVYFTAPAPVVLLLILMVK